ncbi:hypothetical protein MSKOL_3112 [Methanosarcina sp. Kolksee]|nr:hypothetical protein MSKOL_3112 [Methanosarcina sp. Kolksee]
MIAASNPGKKGKSTLPRNRQKRSRFPLKKKNGYRKFTETQEYYARRGKGDYFSCQPGNCTLYGVTDD